MSEVPPVCEHDGNIVLASGVDDLVVPNRTTRFHDRGNAGPRQQVEPVPEREEPVARGDGPDGPLTRLDERTFRGPNPALVPGADTPRGAVADKANQRYWLCADGIAITDRTPMTTASGSYGLPPIGTYPVFARDEDAVGINGEPLERFVAFYTTPKGNRIAFHEVVDQDPATVGDLDQRGASAGCFRVREADSIQVWEFLQVGDPVVVISN